MKNFRYNPLQKMLKKIYRNFFPVPKSPYTLGEVENICNIHLVPPEEFKKFFNKCVKILQDIKGKDIGDYYEFGIFNGSSISSAYLTARKLGLESMDFYGFDAFEGLPEEAEFEDDGIWKKGFYTCSFEKMKECLREKGIDPNDLNWINGWYKDTLNDEALKTLERKKLGIVFIDCDTYSSSKSTLDFIGPLLTEPTIFCFDDWKLNDLDIKELGEYKSFNEFLEKNTHLEATEIKSYNRKSKSFLIQPIKK